jgi:epoxyqueuosine reductase QueG
MKRKIREFVLGMGVDDIGFAAVSDYNSPRSPMIETIFPDAKTIVVMAYKELFGCESPNKHIAMSGRQDLMEFSRSSNYKLARFIEREFNARAMTVPVSYPMTLTKETGGAIGDISLRHAAFAAGLGVFGRHNIIIHPRMGTRVLFSAVLCDLELPSDSPVTEDLCTKCNLCVENCPAGALNEEGKTHVMKCFPNAQPYGLGGAIQFWMKIADSPPEEQKKMFRGVDYWRLYQSAATGFHYYCFNCMTSCPIGQGPKK